MPGPLVIFLHSDAYDRIYQAVNMIATAAAAGRRCYLFLFYHALGSYMAGAWDDMAVARSAGRVDEEPPVAPTWGRTLERSFELANLPSLYEVLERAKDEEGEVTLYACSNSMRYLDLEPDEVRRRVDGIVGLATMLEVSSDAHQILYL
jgi:peroxiredoxin family protein